MSQSSHAVGTPGCPSARWCCSPLRGAEDGTWSRGGEQTPGPQAQWSEGGALSHSQCLDLPCPGSLQSHTHGPQHTLRPVGMSASGAPPCSDEVNEALCVFPSPSQRLRSPDQRRKGFLGLSFTRRENLRYGAAPGLALGKAGAL